MIFMFDLCFYDENISFHNWITIFFVSFHFQPGNYYLYSSNCLSDTQCTVAKGHILKLKVGYTKCYTHLSLLSCCFCNQLFYCLIELKSECCPGLILAGFLIFDLQSRKYELVATVTHHGREPSKGHYTADVRHSNGQWLRFDDSSVTAIATSKVLHDQAYVLFYEQV